MFCQIDLNSHFAALLVGQVLNSGHGFFLPKAMAAAIPNPAIASVDHTPAGRFCHRSSGARERDQRDPKLASKRVPMNNSRVPLSNPADDPFTKLAPNLVEPEVVIGRQADSHH